MNQRDNLIIYPMPSLVSTLLSHEKAKGAPLTEEEVIAIRDSAPSVAMTREQAAKVDESRGYLDIDPENCWIEWQRARVEISDAAKNEPTNRQTERRQAASVSSKH